jgi:hypothetical protein
LSQQAAKKQPLYTKNLTLPAQEHTGYANWIWQSKSNGDRKSNKDS